MPRTVSLGTQVKQLGGLLGTKDLNTWEQDFVKSCVRWSDNGNRTSGITEKQIPIIERLWRKHFA